MRIKELLFRWLGVKTFGQREKESTEIISGLKRGERLKKNDYIILSGKYAPSFWVDSVRELPSGNISYGLIPDDMRAHLSRYEPGEDGIYYFYMEVIHNILIFVER